jgi:hypothetical protein
VAQSISIITRIYFKPLFGISDQCFRLHGDTFIPREGKTKNSILQRPSPNERTCIGWHKRYASVSGRGSRGIYVPRR